MAVKHNFLILLSIIFWSSQIGAQTILRVQGVVRDADAKDPLTGATIQVGTKATSANLDGSFSMDLPEGIFNVSVSYVGYEPRELTMEVKSGVTNWWEIELVQSSVILKTATVTSGRYSRPLAETTVSLEILQPAFIEHTHAASMDEALNRLPGVHMLDGQANIRGGSGFSYGAGSRVMLLIDDVPALQADAGYPNWNDIMVENIEQVEVMKGAGSALYGTAALNGIVNVRTAFAKSTPFTQVSTAYTAIMNPPKQAMKWWNHSPSESFTSLTHRQKFNRLDFAGSMVYANKTGYYEGEYNERARMTVGLRYRVTDRLAIGLNGNLNTGQSQEFFIWQNELEGAFKGGTDNNNAISKKLRAYFDPYVNYFDKYGNRHKVLGRLYWIDNDNNLDQGNVSQLYYSEYQFQRYLASWDMVVTAGILHIWSRVDAELYGDTVLTSRNAASYVQLEKKLWNWLTLTGGFRWEYNKLVTPDSMFGQFVPQEFNEDARPVFRFGANGKLSEGTYLRGSWGQGYRFPTIAEKYINTVFGGFIVRPNVNLRPEDGWSAEFGIKQGVKAGNWNGFLDVAMFWMEYRDMMEFTLFKIPQFQSQNIGNTIIRGTEITLAGTGILFNRPINFMAGYMYLDPKHKEFGEKQMLSSSTDKNILKYRIANSIKADIEAPIHKYLTLGCSYQYNSHMEAIDGIFNLIPGVYVFRQEHNKGFHLLDVRAGLNLTPKWDMWFILKNATNALYSMRPARLESPRNFTVRMNLKM